MKLPDVNSDYNADIEDAEITVSRKSDGKLDPAVVFTSKRSRVTIIFEKHKNYIKPLLPNSSTESLQRNGLNLNYGSPNITAGKSMHKREKSSFSGSRPKRRTKTDRNDTSDTVSVNKVVIKQKMKTMKTMNDNSGNLSKTQAFHRNFICQAALLSRDVNAKRTSVFDQSRNTFISDTASIKLRNRGATLPERRRAVYKDDTHNKSVTQVVSNNNSLKKDKTIEYDSNQDDIFNAQTIRPSNKKGSVRKLATNNKYNISMTQDSSSNILDKKVNKGKTIGSNDEAAFANLMQSDKQTKEMCRIIHENNGRKFTVTKALHVNIILLNNETNLKGQDCETVAHENTVRNTSMKQVSENNKDNNESESIPALLNNGIEMSKPKRIFYETGTGNITIKQYSQLKVTPKYSHEKPITDFGTSLNLRTKKNLQSSLSGYKIEEARNKRNTYDDDEANICLSLAVTPNNYKLDLTADIKKPEEIKYVRPEATEKIKFIDYDEFETNKGEESVTETIATESSAYDDDNNLAISTNYSLLDNVDATANMSKHEEHKEHKQTIFHYGLYQEDILKQTEEALQDNRKSTVFNANHFYPERSIPKLQKIPRTNKNKVMCDNDKCENWNISVVQQIPPKLIPVESEFLNALKRKPVSPQTNITVLQASTTNSSPICSTTDPNIEKVFDGDDDDKIQTDVDEKKGPQSSLVHRNIDGVNKSLIANIESDPLSVAIPQDPAAECMFYVMKNSEVATRTDRRLDSAKHKDKIEHGGYLQRKVAELKKVMPQNTDFPSKSLKEDERDEHVDIEQQKYNQSIADVTRELLSLISTITGNITKSKDDKSAVMEVENQGEAIKHKQLSSAPNRQSIAFSNISMSQAVLQKSCDSDCADEGTSDTSGDISEETDQTTHNELINETTLEHEEKCARLKKTAFDETSYMIDETKEKVIPTYLSEVSDGIKELMTYLVKPVNDSIMVENELIANENTPMNTGQIQANLNLSSHKDKTGMPKVLPVLTFDYYNPMHNILLAPPVLSDVHKYNPIKCYEVEPLTSRKQEKICDCQKINHFGTCPSSPESYKVELVDQSVDAVSTHVTHDEANIIFAMRRNEEFLQPSEKIPKVQKSPHQTNTELSLTDDSSHTMGPALKEEYNKNVSSSKVDEKKPSRNKPIYTYFVEQSTQPAALIFDHRIPMNDIQLSPNNLSDTHKYNPRKAEETLSSSASSFYKMSKGDYEIEKALSSTQYNMKPGVDNVTNGPTIVNKLEDRDDKVNLDDPTIGMDRNKELLGASLLHTFGDKTKGENVSKSSNQSHLKIYSSGSLLVNKEDQEAKIDTITKILGNSSGDQFSSLNTREMLNYSLFIENHKQYSPATEVTPKPTTKMQNVTKSHKVTTGDFTHHLLPEKNAKETNNETTQISKICDKKSPGSKETPIFVEQPNPIVLIFDQNNPLNNIRIAPINITGAHKYEPRQTEDSICDTGNRLMNEVHSLMTTLYVRKPEPSTKQDVKIIYKKGDHFNA